MPTWPIPELTDPPFPGVCEMENYREYPPDYLLRTKMSGGAIKTRKRFTERAYFTGTMKLTESQLDTLDEFFTVVLSGGTVSFTAAHPRKRNPDGSLIEREMTFKDKPKYRHLQGNIYQASMQIEFTGVL